MEIAMGRRLRCRAGPGRERVGGCGVLGVACGGQAYQPSAMDMRLMMRLVRISVMIDIPRSRTTRRAKYSSRGGLTSHVAMSERPS